MKEASLNALNQLDKQLVTIENAIENLIERADLSELSSAECLNFAVKFMNQHSRVLTLKHSLQDTQPEKREQAMMMTLMRQMRGEASVSSEGGEEDSVSVRGKSSRRL